MLEAHPELVTEARSRRPTPTSTRRPTSAARSRPPGRHARANREQVERLREIPDGADFYAPVTSLFRADPTRTDDPVLDALLASSDRAKRGSTSGAGAGRFALPIARALDPSGGLVVALDPSRSMLEGLLEIAEDYAVENVRTSRPAGRPPDPRAAADFEADVALIAHVGYDVEEIGPFLDALEGRRPAACARPC